MVSLVVVFLAGDMADSKAELSQPNNPLSKKLNKILETRFDNDKVLRVASFCYRKLQ